MLHLVEIQRVYPGRHRLAEKAGWDREILAIELQALVDLNFEVELTGFETAEVDLILEEANEAAGAASGPEDMSPAYPAGPLPAWATPPPVRGRATPKWVCPAAEWYQGGVCLHGPALQRSNRRSFLRAGPYPPRRLRDGLRRDERGRMHMAEVLTAGKAAYNELKNVCVWNKSSAGMGT
jgi:hypothetical protein